MYACLTQITEFAKIAEIIAKIIAMVIGAIWAWYGLGAFRRRELATETLRKTELESKKTELELRKTDLELARFAVLEISIKCEVHQNIETNGYIVTIEVNILNSGVSGAYMKFDETSPLSIQYVEFASGGQILLNSAPIELFIPRSSDFRKPIKGRLIRAGGGKASLRSAVSLSRSGVYLVGFRVPMDEENQRAMRDAGANQSRRQYWSASTFLIVPTSCVGTIKSPD